MCGMKISDPLIQAIWEIHKQTEWPNQFLLILISHLRKLLVDLIVCNYKFEFVLFELYFMSLLLIASFRKYNQNKWRYIYLSNARINLAITQDFMDHDPDHLKVSSKCFFIF